VADGDPVGGGVATCGSGPWVGSSAVADEAGSAKKKKKKSWIAIKLVDEDGRPVPDEEYRILLPDGTEVEGNLDKKGFARINGIDPGTCRVAFPELDDPDWRRK
jgi:hypothetical protein